MIKMQKLFVNLREFLIEAEGFAVTSKIISFEDTKAVPLRSLEFEQVSYTKYFTFLFMSEPEFAAKKEKRCTPGKSFACGGSCQPIKTKSGKETQCRKPLKGQVRNYTEFLAKQNQKGKSNSKSSSTKKLSPKKEAQYPIKRSITKYGDFELAANSIFNKLEGQYNGLIPIYRVREEFGNSVSRKDFNDFIFEMQADDKIQMQGGSVEDSDPYKIRNSVNNELDGIRAYLSPLTDKRKTSKKVDDLIKNAKPFDEFDDLRAKFSTSKISSNEIALKLLELAQDYKKDGIDANTKAENYVLLSRAEVNEIFGENSKMKEFDNYEKLQIDSEGKIRKKDTGDGYLIYLDDNF